MVEKSISELNLLTLNSSFWPQVFAQPSVKKVTTVLLFDAHLDLALNGVDWNRDMRCSVDDLRAHERHLGMTEAGRTGSTLSLPELRAAEIGICLSTLLARQEKEINHSSGLASCDGTSRLDAIDQNKTGSGSPY